MPACPCLRIQARVSVSAPSCLPPRVRALTASQVRRAGGRRGPGSREGRGHAGRPPVFCPPSPPRVRSPPGSLASCPVPRRRRRGLPGDLAVGSGVPGFPRGLQVAFRRNSSARICTQRESRFAQAHGSRSPGCVGAGADPDLARPTAGSGAREALAGRRPRPTDRPEAGPRKPTCQSYGPPGWAWEASQRNGGTPWGARLRRDSGAAPGGLVGEPQLRPACAGAGRVPGPVPGPTGCGVFVWASRRTGVCREPDWASWCWMHFHSLR